MSNHSQGAPRALPERPNLRHLKDQAKDLLKAGGAESITDAQFKIACLYGFASWPKLKSHIDSLEEIGQLKQAIDNNDIDRVKSLMTRNPALHRAPLGYSRNGPLTWVAECRIPWGSPAPVRLAIAQWMIENGSDVHQGGDGPLMRAALRGERIPMMELPVAAAPMSTPNGMAIFQSSSRHAKQWIQLLSSGSWTTDQIPTVLSREGELLLWIT
jgi:hypothetical protein